MVCNVVSKRVIHLSFTVAGCYSFGDANAHCAAWRRDVDDARGEKLLEWTNENEYVICNIIAQGPTFQIPRGESFIDVTLSREIGIEDWKVEDRVRDKVKEKPNRTVYDFEATDWEAFKASFERLCRERIAPGMTPDEKAVELQNICRKVCVNKIARREVIGNSNNDWWNEDLRRCKSAVQRARRRWQVSRSEQDRNVLSCSDSRRCFKKTVKISKEKHIMDITTSAINDTPWYRA